MSRAALDTIPTGKDPSRRPADRGRDVDAGRRRHPGDAAADAAFTASNNTTCSWWTASRFSTLASAATRQAYFNDGLMEEISYQTSALPAEAPVGVQST
jgi:hypothetical protein